MTRLVYLAFVAAYVTLGTMLACGVTPAQHAANGLEAGQAAAEYQQCREAAKDGGTFTSFCACVRTVDAKHRIDGGPCE